MHTTALRISTAEVTCSKTVGCFIMNFISFVRKQSWFVYHYLSVMADKLLNECSQSLQYLNWMLVKRKAVPLQPWSGPEDSRKLRFPDFMTTAQDDGKVVILTHRPHLPPGNTPSTHFC
jgi:hypothetical protein